MAVLELRIIYLMKMEVWWEKNKKEPMKDMRMQLEHWYMEVTLSFHWHTARTDNSLAAISDDTKVSPTNH